MNDSHDDSEPPDDNDDLDHLPDRELEEELKDAIHPIREIGKDRICIEFIQVTEEAPVDANNVCNPDRVTFGPYHDVELSDGKMTVTTGDPDCPSFTLATMWGGDRWRLHDGTDGGKSYWVRIRTIDPELLRRMKGEPPKDNRP
jgi:hypothetical protein